MLWSFLNIFKFLRATGHWKFRSLFLSIEKFLEKMETTAHDSKPYFKARNNWTNKTNGEKSKCNEKKIKKIKKCEI